MKKSLLTSLAFAAITFMASCTKDDISPTTSTWTLNGNSYKGVKTFLNSITDGYSLVSLTDLTTVYKGSCFVIFKYKPTFNKTYIIGSSLDSNTVIIGFYDNNDSIFLSNGGNLIVTVQNSKVKATFNNVPVINNQGISSGNATATLIEQ